MDNENNKEYISMLSKEALNMINQFEELKNKYVLKRMIDYVLFKMIDSLPENTLKERFKEYQDLSEKEEQAMLRMTNTAAEFAQLNHKRNEIMNELSEYLDTI